MKKTAMLVVAGLMSLLLAACGGNSPKQPEAKADEQMSQQATTESAPAPAAAESAPAPESAPAVEKMETEQAPAPQE